MRSPDATFDLRAALSREIRGAVAEFADSRPDQEAVHRVRVRLKRARALARIGFVCAPGLSAVFKDSARAIMRTLARSRDLTVLAKTARKTAKQSRRRARAALTMVALSLDDAREALTPVDVEIVRAGLKDLFALAQVWPEASPRQIHRGADRVARRARQAHRHAAEKSAPPARRHKWRQREKDRLYAMLLLEKAWPSERRRKVGERLVDKLGLEHDVVLLVERIEANPAMTGDAAFAERAIKGLRQRHDRLMRRSNRLAAKLHAAGA